MSSALSAIPVERRRRIAATMGLFAALFVAVGLVATTGSTPGVVRVFSAVALSVAALLGLTAWGIVRGVRADLAEQRLDAVITATIAERGGSCGHDHDPTEMYSAGAAEMHTAGAAGCAHDGRGADCAHTCEQCVLAAMRPSPTRSRAQRLAE